MAFSHLAKIEQAHGMYRAGMHVEALGLYTESLSMANTKIQKIALHSNRAACFLKLHSFKEAAEECSMVLELDHTHTGALMLRAQILVTLNDYNSALFDVSRLVDMNPTSHVYQDLQSRLKTQLSLAPIPECEGEVEEEERGEIYEKEDDIEGQFDDGYGRKVDSEALGALSINGWNVTQKQEKHTIVDYSRWDDISGDSSEEEEEEDSQPLYRFRLKMVGSA